MALFGTLATLRAQTPRTEGFSIAFNYVEALWRAGSPVQARVRALASGETAKTELGGGVFVIEQAYETKPRSEGFFESHRNYIDVQAMFEGEELMEVADVVRMTVREPYNAGRDLLVYEDRQDASTLRILPGEAAVFFPVDVHMPSLRVRAEPVLVRKCVVKVPVG